MVLRETSTVALLYGLAVAMLLIPMAAIVAEVAPEGVNEERVAWNCGPPLSNLNGPDVDLHQLRADIAELEATGAPAEERVVATHPQCRAVGRAQVVMAAIAAAAALYATFRWRRRTADARAEKRFKRIHGNLGKPGARVLG